MDMPDAAEALHEDLSLHVLTEKYREFSQHCDAILHGSTADALGFPKIPDELRVLEQKGCFVPDFYMVKPLYYIGIENIIPLCSGVFAKNGAIFIRIPDEEVNLDDLNVEITETCNPDIIESMPVVLFRPCRKPIDRFGKICNDESDDISEQLHCKNDTSEFIGVFKAQRNGESGGNNVYKMTKIFDRYYFDTTKIQIYAPNDKV